MAKSSSPPAAAAVSRSASTASSSLSDAGSSSGGSNGIPTALPTHEAMRILLSPDGYYEYLGIPKPTATTTEMDGFKYRSNNNNNADENNDSSAAIDLERVKKNYRRLSLKHHPDRRTGNAEAFRMLNRAKIVLSNAKLRREYDLLGLDLDDDAEDEDGGGGEDKEEENCNMAETPKEGEDDEEEEEEERRSHEEHSGFHTEDDDKNGSNVNGTTTKKDTVNNGGAHRRHQRPTKTPTSTSSGKHDKGSRNNKSNANSSNSSSSKNGGGGDTSGGGTGGGSKTETVMGHLASASLAAVLQVVVRTGLMGMVSVLISRYTILTYLAIGALAFLFYKLYSSLKKALSGSNVKMTWSTAKESFSPIIIAFGIYCMYRGRRYPTLPPITLESSATKELGVETTAFVVTAYLEWSWTFWLGETIVMTSFLCNSFEKQTRGLIVGFAVLSLLLSLWLRGKFWRYGTLLGLEAFVAMLIVIVFPIMEMILESIVEEKMRKVGEKIRAHDKRMKELLRKEAGAAG